MLYEDMPPDGDYKITVDDDLLQWVVAVMSEYECKSAADAVSTASTIVLNYDEAWIAQILADQLAELPPKPQDGKHTVNPYSITGLYSDAKVRGIFSV